VAWGSKHEVEMSTQSSGILNARKHNVSETRSVSLLRFYVDSRICNRLGVSPHGVLITATAHSLRVVFTEEICA
jgi:hypothetical protein